MSGNEDIEYVPGTNIPKPECKLVGTDGNSFAILGRARDSLKKAGVPLAVLEQFTKKATSRDYDNLLAVTSEYVDVR